MSVLDGKVFSERKEIERLESDNRDAANVSQKNYQEIARLRDLINVRELDNRGFQTRISAMETEVEQNNKRISNLIEVKELKDQENVSTQ